MDYRPNRKRNAGRGKTMKLLKWLKQYKEYDPNWMDQDGK